MNWNHLICALVWIAGCLAANGAPLTAAEIDLLFRMSTPAAEIARDIKTRGLSEPLTAVVRGKFAAAGVTAPAVQPLQSLAVPPTNPARAMTPPVPGANAPTAKFKWPALGDPYPPLSLLDPDGRVVNLSTFRGKVLLIEPIGLCCAACQAYAGGDVVGEFKTKDSHGVQPNLGSIERLFKRFARGTRWEDERIVYIQLLLYGSNTEAPTFIQAREWRAHFSPAWKQKPPVIMVGTPEMIGPNTYAMIPGFHLVDQNLILRYDSTGHSRKHDLYRELLPAIPAMLKP